MTYATLVVPDVAALHLEQMTAGLEGILVVAVGDHVVLSTSLTIVKTTMGSATTLRTQSSTGANDIQPLSTCSSR